MKNALAIVALMTCSLTYGQKNKSLAAAAAQSIYDSTLMKGVNFRLIGPFRGGRSAAVAGSYRQKNTFYFGGTGGGVWKTTDGGSNWKNISDKYFGGSIGAVAVAPSDESVLYVGEGENSMRGNVSEGLGGMWRSSDGGKTWQNLGLKDARHIIRIVVHPKNPDQVWVAAMGHLFGPNTERGVYKTMDGGKTWQRTLYVNDQTGASDLVMEPGNPQVLYAGTWRVLRTPHSLESGGTGSGLWKSTDGGDTWRNITQNKGLPKGTWGIVGVAVAPSNTEKLYAIVEAEKGGLYTSADGGDNWTLASSDNNIRQRAWYYTKVFIDPQNENLVYAPNVGFMVSKDGGKTFGSLRTPHGDHHDLWLDPEDGKRMIVADDGGAQVSFDGGNNWSTYMNQPTVQVYRLSTDNAFPYHILGGQQDNGAFRIKSRSYGNSISAADLEDAAGSESGYVVADPLNPEITYGGNYMGTLERLDHKTGESRAINVWPIDNMGAGADAAKYRFQWNYPIFFSPHNPKRLYAAGNHLFATDNEGKSWNMISPDLTTNDKSKQGPSGGPLTKDNTSVEYYCTIFTAAESGLEKDLLWTGSDDGLIHLSRDAGKNWSNVTPKNLPAQIMWNCVETHPTKKGTAYFAGTRYKLDDYTPYLLKTEDYGNTWTRIDAGIDRMHFTRAIRADRKRDGLLYAGTEFGLYISYNDGKNWQPFQQNLPVVPITDLHLKNNDLIVGTQGRSIYVLDDLSVLQQKTATEPGNNLQVFLPSPAYRVAGSGGGNRGTERAVGENAKKGIVIPYFVKQAPDTLKAKITVLDAQNAPIKTFATGAKEDKLDLTAGLNYFNWDLNYPEAEKVDEGVILWNRARMVPVAPPGNYSAKILVGNDSATVPFTILPDPNYNISPADYQAQFAFLVKARDKFSATMLAQKKIADLRKQMNDYSDRLGKDCPKDVTAMMDSIKKKLTTVEEALHQTKAKSGQDVLNYPIKLDDKLSSVYRVAAAGVNAPSQQVLEAYEVVASAIDEQLANLKSLENNELPALNALIHQKTLPIIKARAPAKQ